MSSSVSKMKILSLYKLMLRESLKFPNYNFRSYAVRRVKDSFKANKILTDVKIIDRELKNAEENLKIIRRQASIGDLYKTDKLVIEHK